MQTMRKQFTGWLPEDSARQSEAGSISEKNGCLSEGTMPRDFELIKLSYFNEEPTMETG